MAVLAFDRLAAGRFRSLCQYPLRSGLDFNQFEETDIIISCNPFKMKRAETMILYRNWRYTITIFEEERKGRDKKEKEENLNDELIGFSAINQNHLEALF